MTTESNFQSIWEYEIKSELHTEFIEAYEPNGLWANLFSQCEGYIKTELKQEAGVHPTKFLTIDHWRSKNDFLAMKQAVSQDYHKLDKQCEAYTLSEKHIGFFKSNL
jgi:heme-degrading monooxygenase HmoA